jgi:hypothetical protein
VSLHSLGDGGFPARPVSDWLDALASAWELVGVLRSECGFPPSTRETWLALGPEEGQILFLSSAPRARLERTLDRGAARSLLTELEASAPWSLGATTPPCRDATVHTVHMARRAERTQTCFFTSDETRRAFVQRLWELTHG